MITIDLERLGRESASSGYRRRRCPGSANLVRALRENGSLPAPEPDPDAQSGIKVHQAWCGEEVDLTPRERDTLLTLQRLEKLVVTDWAGRDEFTLLGREVRLWLHEGLEPIHSGQFDVAYGTLKTNRMLIIDGKTLFGEVAPAETNDQLRELVALARFNYPAATEFTVVILQPWVTHRPSIATYDAAEAELALRLLRLTIADNADPDAPRTPGPWCKYCPALTRCEEARAHLGQTYNLAKRITEGQFALPIGSEGARMLASIETAQTVLKALKASYKALITHEPDAVPGWYLKEGKWVREIDNIAKAYEIASELGISLAEFISAAKLSLGTLSAIVGGVLHLNGKALEECFNQLFSEVISYHQNAPELVSETPRKGRHKALTPPQENLL